MPQDIAPAGGHATASDLIATLRDKAPRIAVALAAGQAALPAARFLRNKALARFTYTVKVSGGDDMYDDLHEWVLGLLPRTEQRALVAWSSRRGSYPIAMPDGSSPEPPPSLRLRYDGTREQAIRVGPHRIKVIVTDGVLNTDERWRAPEILFTAATPAARDALLEHVGEVLRRSQSAKRKPSFRMLDKWGDWVRLDELPARPLDSVILPDGQLERLTGDIARFLAAEDDYGRRGIPWHRGHLYEGPPGTGKTSVARALAAHFGMDIWYLPLADVKKDGELLRLASRISPRSMLLLEDADVFHAATSREEGAESVTLSGLLNALDGIATPHGLLTVLTTNTPDILDDALVRAGRIDLVEHFDDAGADQVRRLVSHYYGQRVPDPGVSGISPAYVIEVCKRHDSALAASAALRAGAGITEAVA